MKLKQKKKLKQQEKSQKASVDYNEMADRLLILMTFFSSENVSNYEKGLPNVCILRKQYGSFVFNFFFVMNSFSRTHIEGIAVTDFFYFKKKKIDFTVRKFYLWKFNCALMNLIFSVIRIK